MFSDSLTEGGADHIRIVIPSVARNLVGSTTERLNYEILRVAQDDHLVLSAE